MRAHLVVLTVAAAACLLPVSCGEEPKPRLPSGKPVAAQEQGVPQLALSRVVSGNPPRYDIAVSDARGRHVRVLTGDSRRASVRPALFGRGAWAPDGGRIAFTAELGKRGLSTDIYVVDLAGSHIRRLTRTKDASLPVWAPDGRTIVFARHGELSGSGAPSSLWSINVDGSEKRPLTQQRDDTGEGPGAFSPDGSRLAFTRGKLAPPDDQGRRRGNGGVFVLNLDGSGERQLTDHGGSPAFSPNGREIAFVSAKDRNGTLNYGERVRPAAELYVMNADGSDQRRLTRTPALNEGSPSWIPDGTRIAFHEGQVTGNAEARAILQINPDGSCPTPVLTDRRLRTWYAAPAWRPGRARSGAGPLKC